MIYCEKILEFLKLCEKKKILDEPVPNPKEIQKFTLLISCFFVRLSTKLNSNNESLINTHILYRVSIVSNKNIKIYIILLPIKAFIPYPNYATSWT